MLTQFASIFKTDRSRQAAYIGVFYLFVLAVTFVVGISATFDSDAYYYFVIARNITSGAGSTFDGVTVTTGYQPLWLGIVTGVHYFFKEVGSFHYAIHGLLTVLFIAGHFLLMRTAVYLGISVRAFMLVSLPLLVLNLAVFQSGLENTLLFCLLSLFIWLHYRSWGNTHLDVVTIALVLLLVYFARLDSIFLIGLYVPWYCVKNRRTEHAVDAILLATIVMGGVFAHWVFMLINFGTIFSTSQIAIQVVQGGGDDALFFSQPVQTP